MSNQILFIFLVDFSHDITNNFSSLDILSNEDQTGPHNKVIIVIFERVVFRQAFHIEFLHFNQVLEFPLSNLYHL